MGLLFATSEGLHGPSSYLLAEDIELTLMLALH